jgi:hypothetical protein
MPTKTSDLPDSTSSGETTRVKGSVYSDRGLAFVLRSAVLETRAAAVLWPVSVRSSIEIPKATHTAASTPAIAARTSFPF